MSGGTLISYAQNREDVVLWRALGHIPNGRYIDVGAWDADTHSVTKVFYDRGWRGINVEPVPQQAEGLRTRRPLDEVLEVAISSTAGTIPLFEIHYADPAHAITGLSTLERSIADAHASNGWDVRDITVTTRTLDAVWDESTLVDGEVHFLKIDVEGAEADVLSTLDLSRHRPWVLVVEATAPNSTEPTHADWEPGLLGAGYTFCLFDGLSRFYVADEHPELASSLSYPACVLDRYTPAEEADLQARIDTLTARAAETAERERANADARAALWTDLLRWRAAALDGWASAVAQGSPVTVTDGAETAALREEVTALRSSLSWRITSPLRRASEHRSLQGAATKLRRR